MFLQTALAVADGAESLTQKTLFKP